jgi:hypothetical protein
MPNPMKERFDRKKRKKGLIEGFEQYKKLTYRMLESEAWRCLPSNHIKFYLELCRRYNGSNNGKLSLSKREAAKLLHIGDGAAQAAPKRLQEHGFIKVTKPGSFRGHPPTNEWQRWRKKKKQKWDIDTIREDALDELKFQKTAYKSPS